METMLLSEAWDVLCEHVADTYDTGMDFAPSFYDGATLSIEYDGYDPLGIVVLGPSKVALLAWWRQMTGKVAVVEVPCSPTFRGKDKYAWTIFAPDGCLYLDNPAGLESWQLATSLMDRFVEERDRPE